MYVYRFVPPIPLTAPMKNTTRRSLVSTSAALAILARLIFPPLELGPTHAHSLKYLVYFTSYTPKNARTNRRRGSSLYMQVTCHTCVWTPRRTYFICRANQLLLKTARTAEAAVAVKRNNKEEVVLCVQPQSSIYLSGWLDRIRYMFYIVFCLVFGWSPRFFP